jgi:hypothetical protein
MDFASALAQLEKSAARVDKPPANRSSNKRGRPTSGPDDKVDDTQRRRTAKSQNDSENDNPLQAMIRLGYRVDPYAPLPPETESAWKGRPVHIGLLALTIDDLPYEHVWRAWAGAANNDFSKTISNKYATDEQQQHPEATTNCTSSSKRMIHVSLVC